MVEELEAVHLSLISQFSFSKYISNLFNIISLVSLGLMMQLCFVTKMIGFQL